MTNTNEVVNDVTPVQTQESEMGDAELQTTRENAGEKSDESTMNIAASFNCEKCGKTFATIYPRAQGTHTGSLTKIL